MIKSISFQLTFFILLLLLCFAPALLADDAMISYYELDIYSPKYRTWDGTSWGGEGSCSNVGGRPYWIVLKSHPTSTEKILGTLDHLYDVNVQVWDGSSWGDLQQVTGSCSTRSYRAFDVAYEQSSKAGLVVYAFNDLTSLGFRSWSGSSWSSESTFLIGATDEINWVTLASKSGSDEILGGFQDNDKHMYAAVWNGSAWGNATWCEWTADGVQCCVDVAYESGGNQEGMVVWGDMIDNNPRFRIWDGSNWSAMSYALDQGATDIRWVKLAADPSSDDIILGTADSGGPDVDVQVWNGSSWGSLQKAGDDTGGYSERRFDVVYESTSGNGMVAYSTDTSIPKFRLWTGSWSAESSASDVGVGAIVKWVQLAPDPASDSIMLMTSDTEADINTQKWSGSSWSLASELASNPSSASVCFDGVYSPAAAPTPAPRSVFSIW